MTADDALTRRAFVDHCADRIANALQARGAEFDEIHEDLPHNLFPSGALHPDQEGDLVADLEAEFARTEYTPSAMGFVLRTPRTGTLDVTLDADLSAYYPIMPSFDDVQRFLQRFADSGDPIKLPPKYRRIPIHMPPTRVSIPLAPTDGFVELRAATTPLQAALNAGAATARADATIYAIASRERRIGRARTHPRVELTDPDQWAQRVATCNKRAEPSWSGKVFHRIRAADGGGWTVELLLGNTTPVSNWVLDEVFIGTVFRAKLAAQDLTQTLLPEVEARDYRHDAYTWAAGRNCDTTSQRDHDHVVVATESVPRYLQPRIRTREWNGPAGHPIRPTFEGLAADETRGVLQALQTAMEAYLRDWNTVAARAPGAASAQDQIAAGRALFQQETERFARGVQLLLDPANRDVLDAFRLMNEAFARRFARLARPGERPAWRLFQLVFIIGELPALLKRDPRRAAQLPPVSPTVLWFPTGAGKTEAYLGLVVLHAFWDRLRGKPFGVTAFAKFPLRMLSLQQFGRVVQVMEHADDVRRTSPLIPDARRGESFSVGYYAGERNTLNLLDFPVSPDRLEKPSSWTRTFQATRDDPERLQRELNRHMKVTNCPICVDEQGRPGRMNIEFDARKPGFRHRCQRCTRELQLHLTDTEVLRWLPTLVIATIDKLARLATEPWGRTIFGEARVRCPQHGYLIAAPVDGNGNAVQECPVLSCGAPLENAAPNVDPVPGLLIQDELHLLTESLGAFASHYETMILETMRVKQAAGVGQGPWKIVGSTATIEGYRQLVRQLYNNGTPVRFPSPGPTRDESFYVQDTPELQRIILGVRSHGMSHVDTVMKILLEYHRIVNPLAEPQRCARPPPFPPPLAGISDGDRATLARRYRTAVTYGINRNEVGQVNTSYFGQLNPFLEREGLPSFESDRVMNLTGDSTVERIQLFLDKIESRADPEYVQAVTATSIISHGVDLDDLNMMVFRGMPHRMSEYIQAMSRVGRGAGVPALVVNVYNPNRERDSSHFESHVRYLELRDILIRNIPTTRFSRQALEKTIPGLVLHYVNYEENPVNLWRKTTVDGLRTLIAADVPRFEAAVRRRLGLDAPPDGRTSLVQRQEEQVPRQIRRIRSELDRRAQSPTESMYASDRLGTLKSLRDTDETIPVYSEGTPEGGGES